MAKLALAVAAPPEALAVAASIKAMEPKAEEAMVVVMAAAIPMAALGKVLKDVLSLVALAAWVSLRAKATHLATERALAGFFQIIFCSLLQV
mmetsp:Transcript_138904/g.252853  ORF Transcript_138904/g.252853 Transcript_138904/m.252853 type:complete len:92 (+) Transcript_138904:646-921(+)